MSTKRYELPLSFAYVPDWTYVEAMRELFQNAIDAATFPSQNMYYMYHEDGERLEIANMETSLPLSSLLIGSTTKRNDDKMIGQHGEGYKVAFMVLLREELDVTVYNNLAHEKWIVRKKHSKRYGGTDIVEIIVQPLHTGRRDLKIRIDKLTIEQYSEIRKSNLNLSEYPEHYDIPGYGKILLDTPHNGMIYINGLYVATQPEFVFSYDMSPARLRLDRDRRMVRTFDLSYETSYMWKHVYSEATGAEAESIQQQILKLINANSQDTLYVSCRTVQDNLKLSNTVATTFIQTYGSAAVPVTTQYEANTAKETGCEPVIVSTTTKQLIEASDVWEAPKVDTPTEQLYAWFEEVKDLLDDEAIAKFEQIYSLL